MASLCVPSNARQRNGSFQVPVEIAESKRNLQLTFLYFYVFAGAQFERREKNSNNATKFAKFLSRGEAREQWEKRQQAK